MLQRCRDRNRFQISLDSGNVQVRIAIAFRLDHKANYGDRVRTIDTRWEHQDQPLQGNDMTITFGSPFLCAEVN